MEVVTRIIQGSLISIFLDFLPVSGNCDNLTQIICLEICFSSAPKKTFECQCVSVSSHYTHQTSVRSHYVFHLILKLHMLLVRKFESIGKLKEE